MKKISALFVTGLLVSNITFAGGLLTNTNQNIAFLRNPARDGAIGIDGVYSNPAGVAFLNKGFHLSLNFQSAYQTREVTSTFGSFSYGARNNGQSSKLFKGEASAPVVPSLQAAYNTDRWSFSFNFAIGGGGGKCAFDDGLGSFESQAALLPLLGQDLGITSYDLDSYMRGRQYYYGFQVGAGYKISDNLSAFVGGRVIYATCNYYGYVRNISVNNPSTGEMTSATGLFGGLMGKAEQASGAFAAQAEAAAQAGNQALAQQLAAKAEEYAAQARQMGTLAVATQDVTLNCDQTGWGFTPILGLDYKIGKFNFGVKYEFKTKIRLDNRAANSESAERLTMLDKYRDGRTVKEDIPALLTIGAQYDILSNLRVMVGYHHFFDKQATQEGNTNELLDKGTNEYLAGVEYDINKRWQISAGVQSTNYGLTDAYMKDMSFNVSSTSAGIGLGVQLTKRMKLNVAYFHTFYKTYDKSTNDYNGVSATIAQVVGQPTADALLAAGALKGSDSFTRTNKVFGLGLDFTF